MNASITKLQARLNDLSLRSSAEAIEIGKALLIIKAKTPHGQACDKFNELGIHKRTAQRYMACARKFSGVSPVMIEAIETTSKMMELLRLNAQQIAELDQGNRVLGINIFQIRGMTTKEVRDVLCVALGALDAPKVKTLSVDEELLLRNYRKCTNDPKKLIVQTAKLFAVQSC